MVLIELTENEQIARSMLCLPLDGIDTIDLLEERVKELQPYVGVYKIGKEAFTAFGPDAIRAVKHLGGEVFLDLKYHDIPNTVAGAVKRAANHEVYLLNVHVAGGSEMMRAAIDSARSARVSPLVAGVTLLTSLKENHLHWELLVPENIDVVSYVRHRAQLAADAGLDGIVSAAEDLADGSIRSSVPVGFGLITPGVKSPAGKVGTDQMRVTSPYSAVRNGSTLAVVGRAITDFETPDERQLAAYGVLQDMARAIAERQV